MRLSGRPRPLTVPLYIPQLIHDMEQMNDAGPTWTALGVNSPLQVPLIWNEEGVPPTNIGNGKLYALVADCASWKLVKNTY